jgi:hypothetical protein
MTSSNWFHLVYLISQWRHVLYYNYVMSSRWLL